MLSEELEDTRRLWRLQAIMPEFATLEHLLLAMTEGGALHVLQGCKVDIEQLRGLLHTHIDDELSSIINPSENLEVQPTSGFRGAARIIHTQSSGLGQPPVRIF